MSGNWMKLMSDYKTPSKIHYTLCTGSWGSKISAQTAIKLLKPKNILNNRASISTIQSHQQSEFL
jgi:hypothetical protein